MEIKDEIGVFFRAVCLADLLPVFEGFSHHTAGSRKELLPVEGSFEEEDQTLNVGITIIII